MTNQNQNSKFALTVISFAALAWMPIAFAQKVELTGNLDPIYSVAISSADLSKIAEGVAGANNLATIKVDINSIYSENDVPAFQAASQEVSRVMIEAAKDVVDMRALLYRLNIDAQRDSQGRFAEQIYTAYQGHFQKRYKALLGLFLGDETSTADRAFNERLSAAMEMCFTTSCLQDIADAQLDMVEFGQSINQRIDLSSTTLWEGGGKAFKSRIVKDTIRKTMDEVLATNKTESAYVKLVRIAAAPFVSAANGMAQAAAEFARFIASPTLSRFKIVAQGIDRKSKDWKKIQAAFEDRVGRNYQKIIADGNGGLAYQAPAAINPSGENGAAAPSRGNAYLTELNVKIGNLSRSVKVDYEGGKALFLGEFYKGSADDAAGAVLQTMVQAALSSGLKITERNVSANLVNFDPKIYINDSGDKQLTYDYDGNGDYQCSVTIVNYNGLKMRRFNIRDAVFWAVNLEVPGVADYIAYAGVPLRALITESGQTVKVLETLPLSTYLQKAR